MKSAVLKENSYEDVGVLFHIVELIVSGQFHLVKLGHSTRMSLSGSRMG